jgi:hypothetical protein
MIEYLIRPTTSEWFAFPKDSEPYRTVRTPYTKVAGWGNGRIEVEGCEISFSDEIVGVQVSFEGEMSQSRADEVIEEIRQTMEAVAQESATVLQISW